LLLRGGRTLPEILSFTYAEMEWQPRKFDSNIRQREQDLVALTQIEHKMGIHQVPFTPQKDFLIQHLVLE